MSLTDKFAMLMARPGGDNAQKDDVPWWMRYAGRGLGTVGSFIAIILGLLNCILVLNVTRLIAGIWQMLAGFIVIELLCDHPRAVQLHGHHSPERDMPDRGHLADAGRVHSDSVRGAVLLLLHRLRAGAQRQDGDAPLLSEGGAVLWAGASAVLPVLPEPQHVVRQRADLRHRRGLRHDGARKEGVSRRHAHVGGDVGGGAGSGHHHGAASQPRRQRAAHQLHRISAQTLTPHTLLSSLFLLRLRLSELG